MFHAAKLLDPAGWTLVSCKCSPEAQVFRQPETMAYAAETMVMELLSDPAIKSGLALLILLIVSATAFFLVSRLRDYTSGDWDSASDGLLNLEEMRLKGDISEEEFRTLQAASRANDDGEALTTLPQFGVAANPDADSSPHSDSDRDA